jgi:hypothetical protein
MLFHTQFRADAASLIVPNAHEQHRSSRTNQATSRLNIGRDHTVQPISFSEIGLAMSGFLNAEKMSHQGKVVMKDRTETKGGGRLCWLGYLVFWACPRQSDIFEREKEDHSPDPLNRIRRWHWNTQDRSIGGSYSEEQVCFWGLLHQRA